MRELAKKFLENEKLGTAKDNEAIIEIELIEYDGEGISPTRFQLFISTLIQLHTNLARIHQIERDNFCFQYFDSGSNVLMGIKAAKPIIESMNTVLMQWWDKIRFRQFDSFDKKVEA